MEYFDSIYMEIIQVFKIVELIKIDIGLYSSFEIK